MRFSVSRRAPTVARTMTRRVPIGVLIATLALLALGFVAWMIWTLFIAWRDAERLLPLSAAYPAVLAAADAIAEERDLSTPLLIAGQRTAVDPALLARLRSTAEGAYTRFRALAGIMDRSPQGAAILAKLGDAHTALLEARHAVDAAVQGHPERLSAQQWIDAVNTYIDTLEAAVARFSILTGVAAKVLAVDAAGPELIAAAVHARGERSVIAWFLQTGRRMQPATLLRLAEDHAWVAATLQDLDAQFASNPVRPAVAQALAAAQRAYAEDLSPARSAILAAALRGAPYPVDAATWRARSASLTRTLQRLADALAGQAQVRIGELRDAAKRSLLAAALGAVLITFLAAASLLVWRRRVKRPARELTAATKRLLGGMIERPVPVPPGAELNALGFALERLRQSLVARAGRPVAVAGPQAQHLQELLALAGCWTWETDADGRLSAVGDGVTALLGWRPEQLLGRSLEELAARARGTGGKRMAGGAARAASHGAGDCCLAGSRRRRGDAHQQCTAAPRRGRGVPGLRRCEHRKRGTGAVRSLPGAGERYADARGTGCAPGDRAQRGRLAGTVAPRLG